MVCPGGLTPSQCTSEKGEESSGRKASCPDPPVSDSAESGKKLANPSNKLEQVASLETRSVSNLIEVMADERWKRLAEQQGVAYAKTVAEAMNLKLDTDNPADREKLRRAVLDLVAGRKMPKQKGRG